MMIKNQPNRKLIKEYFEILHKRNKTIESFANQVLRDLRQHIAQKRLPRQALFFYLLLSGFVIAVIVPSGVVTVLLPVASVGAGVWSFKYKLRPNLRPPITDQDVDLQIKKDIQNIRQEIPSTLDINLYYWSRQLHVPSEVLNVPVSSPINLQSGYYPKSVDDLLHLGLAGVANLSDFYAEIGLDGRDRYSVHVVMGIYLCKNFLTFYKCYWNAISGMKIHVETGEYLYDMIVSVKWKEYSFTVSSNEDQERKDKLVVREDLVLGTSDGKEIAFPSVVGLYNIDGVDGKIPEGLELKHQSPIRDAAKQIRDLLRQRRIDLQVVRQTPSP